MNKPRASNPDNSITVIKTAHCPSLSGKSTLTYQIGFKPKEKQRQIDQYVRLPAGGLETRAAN